MLNRYSALTALVLGFTLLLCRCQFSNSDEENTATVRRAVEQIPTVKVTKVKKADISVPILTSGTVFPDHESKIGPKISGTIEAVYVDEGDHVAKGQILAQLDQKELLIAERQCLAAIQVAETQFKEAELKEMNLRKEKKRLANLLEKNVISQQKYDDIDTAYSIAVTRVDVIKAQISSAEENLAMAKQKIRDTRISAPFSGLIVKRFINQGEYVTTMPPSALFLIMNIDKVKTEVRLPEVYLSQVTIGDPVDITADAYPGNTFRGKVSKINPMVDPMSRAFTFQVKISNEDHKLKPGMFARVKIYPEIHRDTIVVPFKSVMKRDGKTYVFVLEGNTVRLRSITTGITNEREIEVIDGLRQGEVVVVEGHYGMEDNTRVRVVEK